VVPTADDFSFFLAAYSAMAICNILFSLLFFMLRVKATPGILTKSQRWGLTLMGTLFIINSVEIMVIITAVIMNPDDPTVFNTQVDYLFRVWKHLANLSYFLVLALGSVFPRPLLPWSKLKYVILLLGIGGLVVVDIALVQGVPVNEPWLDFGVMLVFPVIWLWWAVKERSAQSRMVLTILTWGFLLTPFAQIVKDEYTATSLRGLGTTSYGDGYILMILLVVSMIAISLWVRRKKWEMPEYTNIAFLFTAILLGIAVGASKYTAIIGMAMPTNGIGDLPLALAVFLVYSGGWMLIRPFLLSIGLLRYQLFGSEIKADVLLNYINWAVYELILGALSQGFIYNVDVPTRAGVAVVVMGVAAYPLMKFVQRVNRKLLPLSGGEARATMADTRTAYLMGLQTAVVKGDIADEYDFFALKNLRKKLSISDREHQLMISYFPKPVRTDEKSEIQELFLILSDGRLVAHAGQLGEEMELVAGMLTAIRGFVKEGLKGGKRELDTVKYGDYTLMMESEEKIVLAALVKGPETTDIRVRLRDTLGESIRLRGDVLRKWDGDSEKVAGLKDLLSGITKTPLTSP
jgi:hypothetical protein